MNGRQVVTKLWALVEEWKGSQQFPPSNAAVGRSVGVTSNAVSQWKSGKAFPDPTNLRMLSIVTGIRYEELLNAMMIDRGYLDGPLGSSARLPTTREQVEAQAAGGGFDPFAEDVEGQPQPQPPADTHALAALQGITDSAQLERDRVDGVGEESQDDSGQ